jgi:hypothetical protein
MVSRFFIALAMLYSINIIVLFGFRLRNILKITYYWNPSQNSFIFDWSMFSSAHLSLDAVKMHPFFYYRRLLIWLFRITGSCLWVLFLFQIFPRMLFSVGHIMKTTDFKKCFLKKKRICFSTDPKIIVLEGVQCLKSLLFLNVFNYISVRSSV